jgi:glutathione S-transferase
MLAGSALLTTAGIGLGLTIYFIKRKVSPEQTVPEIEAKEAQAWLNANLKQLKQDLALGAGPTVRDLASAAQIRTDHLGRFGRMLQTHRAELLEPTASGRVSLEQAAQVMGRIGELTLADDVLKEDAAEFIARHPERG